MANNIGSQAFFLQANPGTRFAIYHSPLTTSHRGGVLFVPPFAEEMNKSRRMSALQARAFAMAGYAVLRIDLYGCGDSSGDFGDARWEVWKADLAMAADWLAERVSGPLHLWGLRLGAGLSLDVWRDQPTRFASALLWQPVINGEVFMTQFLRLAVAGVALRDTPGLLTTETLRRRLHAGEAIEVAGYELLPVLAAAIDHQKLADFTIPDAKVHWLDVRNDRSSEPPPAARRVLDIWRSSGMQASYEAVGGDHFWGTQEIAECPVLISASMARYEVHLP